MFIIDYDIKITRSYIKKRKEGMQNSNYKKKSIFKAKSNVRLKILFPFQIIFYNLTIKISQIFKIKKKRMKKKLTFKV